MSEFLAKVKEHPYLSAGAVFVIGVVVIIYLRRGSTATPVNNSASSFYNAQAAAVSSANQLAAYQTQYQAATNSVNQGAQVALQNGADQVQVAQLAAQTAQDQTAASADVMKSYYADAATVAEQQSTLSAAVANNTANDAANVSIYNNILDAFKTYFTANSTGVNANNSGQDYLIQGSVGGTPFSLSAANYEQEPYIIDPSTGLPVWRQVNTGQPATAGGFGGSQLAPGYYVYNPASNPSSSNAPPVNQSSPSYGAPAPGGNLPSSLGFPHSGAPFTMPMLASTQAAA